MLLSPLVQLSCTALTISPSSRQALKPLRHHQRVLSGPNQSAFRKQWFLAEASVNVWVDLNVTEFASLPSFLQVPLGQELGLEFFFSLPRPSQNLKWKGCSEKALNGIVIGLGLKRPGTKPEVAIWGD